MEKTILTTGTFNVCHAGHIRLFEFCSKLGRVVVGVNSDLYLWEKYGKELTVPLIDRLFVLSSCKFIDEIIVFPEKEPSNLIKKIKPDIYVKGPDYAGKKIPEQEVLDSLGINLVIQPTNKEYNSSDLIHLIKKKSSYKTLKRFD